MFPRTLISALFALFMARVLFITSGPARCTLISILIHSCSVGREVGTNVGATDSVGFKVGSNDKVGIEDGRSVGAADGRGVVGIGVIVGTELGASDGGAVGSTVLTPHSSCQSSSVSFAPKRSAFMRFEIDPTEAVAPVVEMPFKPFEVFVMAATIWSVFILSSCFMVFGDLRVNRALLTADDSADVSSLALNAPRLAYPIYWERIAAANV
jgi:hypothetical protein